MPPIGPAIFAYPETQLHKATSCRDLTYFLYQLPLSSCSQTPAALFCAICLAPGPADRFGGSAGLLREGGVNRPAIIIFVGGHAGRIAASTAHLQQAAVVFTERTAGLEFINLGQALRHADTRAILSGRGHGDAGKRPRVKAASEEREFSWVSGVGVGSDGRGFFVQVAEEIIDALSTLTFTSTMA